MPKLTPGLIVVGLPTYENKIHVRLNQILLDDQFKGNRPGFMTVTNHTSLLARGFNELWCFDPVCICDLNPTGGNPNAADALTGLNVSVGTPGLLNCDCGTTTTTSTTLEPPTTTTTSTTTTTGGGGGACPDTVELAVFGKVGQACSTNDDCEVGTCDTGLSLCASVTELDTGWKGISHDADVNDRQQIIANLDCGAPAAPCGVCDVAGINPTNRMCRCANDNQAICDEPFVADADDCGGAVCNCYLGPPLPLSAGNTPACVVNRLGEDVSGTVNVDAGDGCSGLSFPLHIDGFYPEFHSIGNMHLGA